MQVNPMKGEMKLRFPSQTIKGRLSVDTILLIEESLGKSILMIVQNMSEYKITLAEMVEVMYYVIKTGGNTHTIADVKQLFNEIGYTEAIKMAGECLAKAIDPDQHKTQKKKEEKAPVE